MTLIAVLDYGIGNLRSVEKALEHVGAVTSVTRDQREIASADGVVVVLDAGEELKILAANKLDAGVLATPAIVEGNLYVRTESHLYAFGN